MCQRTCGRGPLLIWPSGKRGRKKGDDGGGREQSAWRAGRAEGEERREGGGRRDVYYCSTVEGGVSQ